ncbi:PREDICTED: alpha-glucosidase-like [Dinoponera quadriceps]|uniref:alpha-glucosidase n=1 Tax=Dinoponera quadriceps TaxID=609295 RepID=A0A6P3WUK3_DINQU|nr:PREDICTED: alpha-glucosidase-like [Dinoponera quadriceps]
MFRSCISIAALVTLTSAALPNKDWYRNSLVYQIYPRSFKDSNGDGIGDLNGITSKLEHIADIGAQALWMSPIYPSPLSDFGYDISNFTDIHKDYGTLDHFDQLVAKAKSLGLKVLLDFVPNHSSDEHEWFKKSIQRIKPYDEYYVWRDPKMVNGTRQPPNNWLSVFRGSAWEWNPTRKQYYLHQFDKGQPDLNYHSDVLQQEMKNVLKFWMARGVEGFRIDAINHMYEDDRFLDEPRINVPGLPDDDYDTLDHIYTKNLPETYNVLRSWRQVLDEHSEDADMKMILTEAYVDVNLTIKYYQSGSTVPFNFMFIAELNNKSSAVDFKLLIDRWMNHLPNDPAYVANWVVGNHDNHRAASRFGVKRADQLSMLATILPGVSVIYNGDEIGMVDRPFTYEETVDPAGCNAGPDRYHLKSRDPERTPFQWDNSTSAGFSTNATTWLPVHSNYKTLNLAAQKTATVSHYKVFKSLAQLKRKPVIEQGKLEIVLVTKKILGAVRRHDASIVALMVNFDNSPVTVDARAWMNIPERLIVYASSVDSKLLAGTYVDTTRVTMPASASVVLATEDLL